MVPAALISVSLKISMKKIEESSFVAYNIFDNLSALIKRWR